MPVRVSGSNSHVDAEAIEFQGDVTVTASDKGTALVTVNAVAALTDASVDVGLAGGVVGFFGATAAPKQNLPASGVTAAQLQSLLVSYGLATGCSAATSGTAIAGGVLESEIVTGGMTAILTLTGGTWAASGTAFNAARQAIIDGFTAAEAEAGGWNLTVKVAAVVTNVVRTSSTIVTVTLPATAGYSITANENVTITIPAAALADVYEAVVSAQDIVVTHGS